MKLVPAPNLSKANAVGKYHSILRFANDSWSKAESSYKDSSSYDYKKERFDSLQEECLRVANRHHCNKKRIGKSSSSSSLRKEERKPKKKAVEVVVTCKHCKKYGKTQHLPRFTTDQCMWNKKAVCFRYTSVCKQMGLKYVKVNEFEMGKEDKWQKHKAKAVKDDKKENNND